MKARGAEIGSACRVRDDRFAETLELAFPDLRQVGALWPTGRARVQVHGDAEFLADGLPQSFGEADGVGHGGGAEGHERHDVRRAHPRVLAALDGEIDRNRRDSHHAEHGVEQRVALSVEGDYAPVVVRVPLDVKDRDTGHGSGGVGDTVHLG